MTTSKHKKEMTLRVALFREEAGSWSGWVAKCLDYDIVAQGATPAAAQKSFVHILESHIALSLSRGEEPLIGICCDTPKSTRKPKQTLLAAARNLDSLKLSYQRLSEPEVFPAFA